MIIITLLARAKVCSWFVKISAQNIEFTLIAVVGFVRKNKKTRHEWSKSSLMVEPAIRV
jgi:hypothetical protein